MPVVSGRRLVGTATAVLGLVVAGACGDEVAPGSGDDGPARYEASLTVLESPTHGPHLCHSVATSDPPQCSGLPVAGWDWEAVDDEESRNGTTWGSWHVVGTYEDGEFRLAEPPGPRRVTPPPDPAERFAPACDRPDVADPSHGAAEWEAMSQDFGPFEIPGEVTAWVSNAAPDATGPFVGNVVVTEGSGAAAKEVLREHYLGPLCVVERGSVSRSDLGTVQEELFDDEARKALGQVQSGGVFGTDAFVTAEVWILEDAARRYARERWGDLVVLEPILRPVES